MRSRGTTQGTRGTTQGTRGTTQGTRGAAQGTRGAAPGKDRRSQPGGVAGDTPIRSGSKEDAVLMLQVHEGIDGDLVGVRMKWHGDKTFQRSALVLA